VGDVITFQKEPGKAVYVTHRIRAIDDTTTPPTMTTKGDANRGADLEPVPATAVRGKVWFHVPYLGTVRNTVSTGPFGLAVAILGLAGYAVAQVVSAVGEKRKPSVETSPTAAPAPSGLVLASAVDELAAAPELLAELERLVAEARARRDGSQGEAPRLWVPTPVRREVARPATGARWARRAPGPALAAVVTVVLGVIARSHRG
jgi:hypothetical protein